MKEEHKKEIRELIDESVKSALSPVTIPKGYTRCANCGTLIKENEPCRYCPPTTNDQTTTEPEPEEPEPEELDAIDELMKD
jgi:rubrerythrin